jgi:hypothetical protein
MVLAMEGAKVKVENTDDGVNVVITPAQRAAVEGFQNQVKAGMTRLHEMVQRVRERGGAEALQAPAEGRAPAERPGAGAALGPRGRVFMLMVRGELDIVAENVPDGVLLKLSSDKPEIVTALQKNMPQWVAQAQERRRMLPEQVAGQAGAPAPLRLLAQEDVSVKVNQKEGGVSIDITSEDPAVARRIKQELPAFFRQIKQRARQARQEGAEAPRPRREPRAAGQGPEATAP